jgi:hypothetical protein
MHLKLRRSKMTNVINIATPLMDGATAILILMVFVVSDLGRMKTPHFICGVFALVTAILHGINAGTGITPQLSLAWMIGCCFTAAVKFFHATYKAE